MAFWQQAWTIGQETLMGQLAVAQEKNRHFMTDLVEHWSDWMALPWQMAKPADINRAMMPGTLPLMWSAPMLQAWLRSMEDFMENDVGIVPPSPVPAFREAAVMPMMDSEDAPPMVADTPSASPSEPLQLAEPDGEADDLTRIKGIGAKLASLLNALGIFHLRQIAEWTDEQAAWVDEKIDFKGRVAREGWREQAQALLM